MINPDIYGTLRAANIARQKEMDVDDKLDLSFRAMELGGEVGEALNVCKKLVREKLGIVGKTSTVLDLADELADVIICVDLIAGLFNINLIQTIESKFNRTSMERSLRTALFFRLFQNGEML